MPRELAETSLSLGKNTSLKCLDSTAFSSTSSVFAPVAAGILGPSAGMVAQGSSDIMFLMAWRLSGFPDHLETVWMRSAYFTVQFRASHRAPTSHAVEQAAPQQKAMSLTVRPTAHEVRANISVSMQILRAQPDRYHDGDLQRGPVCQDQGRSQATGSLEVVPACRTFV